MNTFLPAVTLRSLAGNSLLVGALALAGCATPGSIAPQETLPSAQEVATRLQLVALDAGSATTPAADWWTAYQDPELTHWIRLGLSANTTIKEAAARVAQAQAALQMARAGEQPRVGASASAVGERLSNNGIFPPPLGGMVHTIDDIDLSATLELDLWGQQAARSEAARQELLASTLDGTQVSVRLAASIAHAYFDLARAQQARRVALELEEARSKTLALVEQRVHAGLDTQVESRLAAVTVPEIRVEIARADEQIALARHTLAVLAGQPPQAADAVDARLPESPALALPAALPLDLLARRADIAAARHAVEAAQAEVKSARAQFYPNVSISGLIGLDSLTTQKLLRSDSRTWQVGPAVHLPLFEGGALRAELSASSARTDAAIDRYTQAILRAAREVSDALSSREAVQRQREQQRLATENAQAAADLATIRYRAGLGTFLTVLTAETGVLVQRRAQLDLDARAAALDVSLALALGGGFRETAPEAP